MRFVKECFAKWLRAGDIITPKSHLQPYILVENELKIWGLEKFWESEILGFYNGWKSCGELASPKTKLKNRGGVYIWNPHQRVYPPPYLFR